LAKPPHHSRVRSIFALFFRRFCDPWKPVLFAGVKCQGEDRRLDFIVGSRSRCELPEWPRGRRFFPLTPITSEHSAEIAADGITEVFQQCGTSEPATLRAIGTTLSEILGNCFFHSQMSETICGLACAQSWPARSLAQVAVVDTGIGIRASLSANPAYAGRLAVENANALATELGVTGKPEGRHSGYGLTLARQLMQNHGGNLIVLSGDEAFRASGRTARERKLRHTWPRDYRPAGVEHRQAARHQRRLCRLAAS